MPERVLWLVDECVMKSELPEGLKHLIERVIAKRAEKKHCLLPSSDEVGQSGIGMKK